MNWAEAVLHRLTTSTPAAAGQQADQPVSLPSLTAAWRADVPAAIVVFLVALPLCLGIALASEAPLFAGIISGIVGGIVVGALSGSQLMVSGPAAGLTEKERKRMEAEARQKRSAVEGPIKKEIAKLEESISKLEAAQKEREAQLADPVLYNDFAKAKPLMDTHREGKEQLEQLYAQWEAAQEKLAAASASL